jgi:hypothetical protein
MKRLLSILVLLVGIGSCRDTSAPLFADCDYRLTGSGPMVSIKFTESLRVRACHEAIRQGGGFGPVTARALLEQADVQDIIPLFSLTQEELDRLYEDVRRNGGTPIDLVSWHRVRLQSNADTGAVLRFLNSRTEVDTAYFVSDVNPPPP